MSDKKLTLFYVLDILKEHDFINLYEVAADNTLFFKALLDSKRNKVSTRIKEKEKKRKEMKD